MDMAENERLKFTAYISTARRRNKILCLSQHLDLFYFIICTYTVSRVPVNFVITTKMRKSTRSMTNSP